jgi:hypothetical protein
MKLLNVLKRNACWIFLVLWSTAAVAARPGWIDVTWLHDRNNGNFTLEAPTIPCTHENIVASVLEGTPVRPVTFVIPKQAENLTSFDRFMTGRGNYTSALAFEALPGEVHRVGGVKLIHG